MNRVLLTVFLVLLAASTVVPAAPHEDVTRAPACSKCSMDREKFGHSRMLIEYGDGTEAATCSLHCAAVELAVTIDRMPVKVSVADYNTKALLDAEEAVWVLGGSKKGVMTAQAKWAFADHSAAERFIQANGGKIATFDQAMKSAYEGMYQDTRMIREFRQMTRTKHKEDARAH